MSIPQTKIFDHADFSEIFRERIVNVLDQKLALSLPYPSSLLHQAMRYAVLNGGKRLRPLLVYATGLGFEVPADLLDDTAAAVELIHCYSLVHDDLPAMDDDQIRRGKPTCHRAFNEATAILVGDALQSLAFELLAEAPGVSAQQRLKMVAVLAKACGAMGMAAGQQLDLAAENQPAIAQQCEIIYKHKTAALITASILIGALACKDMKDQYLEHLQNFGQCFGAAFQIQDDILNIAGDPTLLGKKTGTDQKLHKSTYPAIIGLTQAKKKTLELYELAEQHLEAIPYEMALLKNLVEIMQQRQY